MAKYLRGLKMYRNSISLRQQKRRKGPCCLITTRGKGRTGPTRIFSSKANVSICIRPLVHTGRWKVSVTRWLATCPKSGNAASALSHLPLWMNPSPSHFELQFLLCIRRPFVMFVTQKVPISSKLRSRGSVPGSSGTFQKVPSRTLASLSSAPSIYSAFPATVPDN